MAFSALTAAEVDAKSPVDSTLWTKVKDNFDALASGQGMLYRFGDHGSYYTDASAATIEPGASYTNQAAGTSKAQLASIQFYVPSGVSKVYCSIRASCSRTNADSHYDVTIDGTTITFASLPGAGSIDWQTAQSVTIASSGYKAVSVNSHNESGGNVTFNLSDLIIYAGQ